MKTLFKSRGVTLLEIMLVLAIASMIIVMSIRYYQSANQSSQVNAFLTQVQGITAAVDSLAQGSSYNTITQATVTSVLGGGANALVPPWGGSMTFAATTSGYTLTPNPAPAGAVCTMVTTRLKTNSHYTVGANCGSITYNANT